MKLAWLALPVLALAGGLWFFVQEPPVDDTEKDWDVSEEALVKGAPALNTQALPEKLPPVTAPMTNMAQEEITSQEYDSFVQELDQDAINSMAEARLHGDPRAPAINPSPERVLPTPEELQDHDQYVQYEQRQEKKIYRAYVDAAKEKVAMLNDMIKQGEEEGISEEELEQARQKAKGIEEMSLQLQQDHPDIMTEEYQPAAKQGWLNPPETTAP